MLFTNWHKYLIGGLLAIEAVCVALQSGAVPIPAEYHGLLFPVEIAGVFLAAVIPNWRDTSGPGTGPTAPVVPHG